MVPTVTVVDFGAGNLLSVCRALVKCGAEIRRARTAEEVLGAERLVLPGVGAFGACMSNLATLNLIEPIRAFAATGHPFLGICVGMQMLFDESDEFGCNPGLGLIPGRVEAVPPHVADGQPHRIPHVGWNALLPAEGGSAWAGTPLDGITPGESVYFVHSFAARPRTSAHMLAYCDYDGIPLTAAVRKDNVTGCQFHPEKSGAVGLAILSNFLRS